MCRNRCAKAKRATLKKCGTATEVILLINQQAKVVSGPPRPLPALIRLAVQRVGQNVRQIA